jgi:hypothetical protein
VEASKRHCQKSRGFFILIRGFYKDNALFEDISRGFFFFRNVRFKIYFKYIWRFFQRNWGIFKDCEAFLKRCELFPQFLFSLYKSYLVPVHPCARGPQDGPNVHHGLSLMSQSLIFYSSWVHGRNNFLCWMYFSWGSLKLPLSIYSCFWVSTNCKPH